MPSKIKVDLECRNGIREVYTVTRVVNTLDPKPGDRLSKAEASDLVSRVSRAGGSVTVTEARR